MAINRKQYIVNLHTSKAGNFSGNTELFSAMKDGEIAVQEHENDTAIYVKRYLSGTTVSAGTHVLARFIPEDRIEALINSAAAASTTQVKKATGATQFDGLSITSAINQSTSAAIYTISLTNVAKADELDAVENAIGLTTAGTYTATTTHFTSGASSVMEAITMLDNAVSALTDSTEDALEALDFGPVTETGKVIKMVSQTNGKVSATTDYLVATDVTIASATPSSTNVKEEYKLVNGAGTQLGQSIKIYKDSSLAAVYLGHVDDQLDSTGSTAHTTGTGDDALCFIYHKGDGSYELVAVNVESFLAENEFEDGLEVDSTAHTVSVKIDNTTGVDPYLSVGPNGVKLSGITAAIQAAQNAANTKVAEGQDPAEVMSITPTTGNDGSVTYTIDLTNIATADAVGLDTNGDHVTTTGRYTSAAATIAGEIAALDAALSGVSDDVAELSAATQNALEGLDYTDTAVTGQFVYKVDEANGKITPARSYVTDDYVKIAATTAANQTTYELKNGAQTTLGDAIVIKVASGVQITNGVINGEVDSTSEAFLTVGAGGFKLSGVQQAIDAAKASGTTVVSAGTSGETNEHLEIHESEAADGHKIYTIDLKNVADENEVVKTVVVNGKSSTFSANTATTIINSDDILLGTAITSGTGSSAGTILTTSSSITQALQYMQNEIDNASTDAVQDVDIINISGVTETRTETAGGSKITFNFEHAVIDGGEF